MGKILVSALLAFTLVLGSCQSKDREDHEESAVQRATTMMDRGDFTGAIEILTPLYHKNPTDETALHLASAYAGRAGLKVETYWGYAVGYKDLLEAEKSKDMVIIDTGDLPVELSESVQKELRKLNENLSELRKIKRRMEQVPYMNLEKRRDLQRGAVILSQVQTRGGRLYRAILELVLLRSAVEDSLSLAKQWSSAKTDFCDRRFTKAVEWATYAYEVLIETLSDLRIAFPKKQDEIDPVQKELLKNRSFVRDMKNFVRKEGRELCKRP